MATTCRCRQLVRTSRLVPPSASLLTTSTSTTFATFPSPTPFLTSRRHASFIPGTRTSTSTLTPSIPKPPNPHWYTGRPFLKSTQFQLTSLIHRTRHALHAAKILTRYQGKPSFAGTGINLRFLRWKARDEGGDGQLARLFDGEVKWLSHEDMQEKLLKGSETSGASRKIRVTDYNTLVGLLNELRALQRYVAFANTMPSVTGSRDLQMLMSEIEALVDEFGVVRAKRGEVGKGEDMRDALGRYRGRGRKKEASATAYLVEVKMSPPSPESLLPPTSNATTASASTPSASPEEASKAEASPATSYSGINDTSASQPRAEAEAEASPPAQVEAVAAPELPPVGKVRINGLPLSSYFPLPSQRAIVLRPFEITHTMGHYNVHLLVRAGGLSSQAHAAAMALSQALMKALGDKEVAFMSAEERWARKVLSRSRLAARDPRVVERKRLGGKGQGASAFFDFCF